MTYTNNKDFTNFRLFNNKFSYLYIKYSDLIGILIDGEPIYTFNIGDFKSKVKSFIDITKIKLNLRTVYIAVDSTDCEGLTGYSFEKYPTGYHYLKGRQEIYANSEGRTFIELISKREYFEQTGIK